MTAATKPAAEIARMRKALQDRLEAHAKQQNYLARVLREITRIGTTTTGSVEGDLEDLLGRINDAMAHMRLDFSEERAAVGSIRAALYGIWERSGAKLGHQSRMLVHEAKGGSV